MAVSLASMEVNKSVVPLNGVVDLSMMLTASVPRW
jgi:hypothetical protein